MLDPTHLVVRRSILRGVAFVVGLALLGPLLLVAPSASAWGPDPMSARSTSGLRGVDFRSVAHGIDRATSAVAVEAVRHGDLDGDGVDDAVVVLSYDTEYGPEWVVQTYGAGTADRGGVAAEPSGRTYGFASSWENFDRLDVRDGFIEFTVRQGAETERDGWLEVQRWALVGDELRLLERRPGGAVLTLDSVGPRAPATIAEWETRTFLDVGPGGARRGVVVEVGEAKSLRMRADDLQAQVRVYDATSGRLAHQVDAGGVVSLGADRTWYVEPVTAVDRWTRIELVVADQRALFAPELIVRQFEAGHDDSPRRSVSLSWYEVDWAHGAVDLDRVNGLIRGHIDDIRAEHEAAAADCDDGTDATLFVGATPELISYDLISLRLTIASCLCERNDEIVEESLVVDLAASTVHVAADLVTSPTAVSLAWRDQFEAFQAQHYDPVLAPTTAPLELASVSLTPMGLVVSVPAHQVLAEASAEDVGWFVTEMLTFDEYPGLVDATIEQRARSGRDVSLPYNECGC